MLMYGGEGPFVRMRAYCAIDICGVTVSEEVDERCSVDEGGAVMTSSVIGDTDGRYDVLPVTTPGRCQRVILYRTM